MHALSLIFSKAQQSAIGKTFGKATYFVRHQGPIKLAGLVGFAGMSFSPVYIT